MLRSLETLPDDLRAMRLAGMRKDCAARLARVTAKKGRRNGKPGVRFTFPNDRKAGE